MARAGLEPATTCFEKRRALLDPIPEGIKETIRLSAMIETVDVRMENPPVAALVQTLRSNAGITVDLSGEACAGKQKRHQRTAWRPVE